MSKKDRLQMQRRSNANLSSHYQTVSNILSEFTASRSEKLKKVSSKSHKVRLQVYRMQRDKFIKDFEKSVSPQVKANLKDAILLTELCIEMFRELTEVIHRHNESISRLEEEMSQRGESLHETLERNQILIDEIEQDEELKKSMLLQQQFLVKGYGDDVDITRDVIESFLGLREGFLITLEHMLFDVLYQENDVDVLFESMKNNFRHFMGYIPAFGQIADAFLTVLDNVKLSDQKRSNADEYHIFLNTYQTAAYFYCVFAQIATEGIANLASEQPQEMSYEEIDAKVRKKRKDHIKRKYFPLT